MTVQNTIVKNVYEGNGSTTVFPYTFPLISTEHIKCYHTDSLGSTAETTNYTLGDGSIIYPKSGSALGTGEKLTIARELPLYQSMNLVNQGTFFAEDIEKTFDEIVMMIQQLSEIKDRTLKLDISENTTDMSLTVPRGVEQSLAWDEEGKKLVLTEDPAKVIPIVDAKVLELQNYIQAKSDEIQQLVASLNSLTREELQKLRDECAQYALDAENAALANSRWPTTSERERTTAQYDYGLTGADLVFQVPTTLKIDVEE